MPNSQNRSNPEPKIQPTKEKKTTIPRKLNPPQEKNCEECWYFNCVQHVHNFRN